MIHEFLILFAYFKNMILSRAFAYILLLSFEKFITLIQDSLTQISSIDLYNLIDLMSLSYDLAKKLLLGMQVGRTSTRINYKKPFRRTNIFPICLPSGSNPLGSIAGQMAEIVGWGKTTQNFGNTGTNRLSTSK